MADRRAYDPFAPPAPPPPEPEPEQAIIGDQPALDGEVSDETPAEPADGLDGLRKPELVQIATDEGLPTDGTRADLITRIRDARG